MLYEVCFLPIVTKCLVIGGRVIVGLSSIIVVYLSLALTLYRQNNIETNVKTTHIFNVKVPEGPVLKCYFRGCFYNDVVTPLGTRTPILLTFYLERKCFSFKKNLQTL